MMNNIGLYREQHLKKGKRERRMDYISIQGDEYAIILELSKYMNEGGARLIIQNMSHLMDILSDDERFDVEKEKLERENMLGFIVPKTNYYLNVKKTTIAFIGLLFDIQFTEGFASFVLNIFGITAETIRKLKDIEKCVLLLLKMDFIIIDNDEYRFHNTPQCMNFALECTYRQYDKCCLSNEAIYDTIQSLLHKKVVKRKGNTFIYCF